MSSRSTDPLLLADEDPKVVFEKAKGRNHVIVHGRVPTERTAHSRRCASAYGLGYAAGVVSVRLIPGEFW